MFSKPTAFLTVLIIATAAFATAASATVEYHGGPKSPWSVSSEKSRIDREPQNTNGGFQHGVNAREHR
jgi:hypothetical protein